MLHCTIHPHLPPELLDGFVDTPTILLILLLGHICKQWLGGEERSIFIYKLHFSWRGPFSWKYCSGKMAVCVSVSAPGLLLGENTDVTNHKSPTYNAVPSSLPRQLNNHLHLGSPSTSNPHEGQLGPLVGRWPNDSETQRSRVLNGAVRTLPHRV